MRRKMKRSRRGWMGGWMEEEEEKEWEEGEGGR